MVLLWLYKALACDPIWISEASSLKSSLFSDANPIDSNCFSCSPLWSLPSQLSTPTHLHHRKLSDCGAQLLKFPFSWKFQFCAAQKQLPNISYPVFIAVTNLEGLVKLFNHRHTPCLRFSEMELSKEEQPLSYCLGKYNQLEVLVRALDEGAGVRKGSREKQMELMKQSWQHSSPSFNCSQVQETSALYAVCLYEPLNFPLFLV